MCYGNDKQALYYLYYKRMNLWFLLEVVRIGWSRVHGEGPTTKNRLFPRHPTAKLLKKSKSSTVHVAAESVRATIGLQRHSLFVDEGTTSARRCMVTGAPHTSAGRVVVGLLQNVNVVAVSHVAAERENAGISRNSPFEHA